MAMDAKADLARGQNQAYTALTNKPPNTVDIDTQCQYERQAGEAGREYQPVMQRVSERAKVKLYVRKDLKKEQATKDKYHRHIDRQLHDNAYQKKITLEDFVSLDNVDFGIKKTVLENETVIPNQELHLEFYPQKESNVGQPPAHQDPRFKPQAARAGKWYSPQSDAAQREAEAEVTRRIEGIAKALKADAQMREEGVGMSGTGQTRPQGQGSAGQARTSFGDSPGSPEKWKSKYEIDGVAPALPASGADRHEQPGRDPESSGPRTPRLQALMDDLLTKVHRQAKTTSDKIEKAKKDRKDFANLQYYQQYLAKNELGQDIFRTQQKEFNDLLEKFQHRDDWFKEVLNVRKHKLLHPEKDLDGDGIADEEQEVLQIRGGVAGQLMNGVFYTREQLEEKIEQRRRDYFNLFTLAQRINAGLKGDLTQHGIRERLSKLKSIDDLHKMMTVQEMLSMIQPAPEAKKSYF